MTGDELAQSICRKIAEDGKGGYDGWYIDVSVSLTAEEIAFLNSLNPEWEG